jgi:hypothetical protein
VTVCPEAVSSWEPICYFFWTRDAAKIVMKGDAALAGEIESGFTLR